MKTLYENELRTNNSTLNVKVAETPKKLFIFPSAIVYPCCSRHIRYESDGAALGYGFDIFAQVHIPKLASLMVAAQCCAQLVVRKLGLVK